MARFECKIPKFAVKKNAFDQRVIGRFLVEELNSTIANLEDKAVKQGVDADGKAFPKYSAGYEAWKKEKFGNLNYLWVSGDLMESRRAVEQAPGQVLTYQSRFVGQHRPSKRTKKKRKKKSGVKTERRGKTKTTRQKTTKSGGSGGGGATTNAALARSLYDRGFINWHAFGKDDLARIDRNFDQLIATLTDKLIE